MYKCRAMPLNTSIVKNVKKDKNSRLNVSQILVLDNNT